MQESLRALHEFGFDVIMGGVYFALVDLGRATIKQIQGSLQASQHLSYSQVHYALKKLHALEAVEIHRGLEDAYTPSNPRTLFEQLRKRKWDQFVGLEQDLSDRYERATRDFGACTIQSNRFYFSSLDLGFKILTDRFLDNAREVILFLAPPPVLLLRLQGALIRAYGRGVKIEIHYSDRDFEEVPNYSMVLLSLCKAFRVKILCREYRTYDAVAVNDEYTRVSSILIDNRKLISAAYYRASGSEGSCDFGIDYLEGFFHAPDIVKSIITGFPENPIVQMIEYMPPRESQILEYLKDHPATAKHELSTQLRIAGTDLKVAIERLVRFGAIHVERVTRGAGRPVEVVSIAGK